jgi:hypothetical protein
MAILVTSFGIGCIATCLTTSSSAQQSDKEIRTADASVLPSETTVQTGVDEAQNGTTQADEHADDPEKHSSFWMEQKLRLSKEILTALATADFEAMGKNAEIMRGLNRVERFVRRGPEGYRDQLKQFNMANNALIRASRKENLEAATLAFNQLTISCVSCHQHLREAE